ncbi:MAG: Orotate phosphoribosyltransferase [Candidatus Beckwithbacteria bacterium GW2011_GWA2_43_10]|uniref:Orotate phosphoribosyltransferase n=1 Tax=Candidatus Beckwithbacteria bacterium GW2011_GWA2_43_10 TaxID=1618369 RepID=A0A0G1EC97_9BACT|nr:MAG: Orotate phosphoribosyltransferase [Candidatus Beckwithbacteria bacterium GW2011_GWA2_43_10]
MNSLDQKIARETAKLLLSIKAITLSPNKPYRYTSGMLSPIYCDNRLVMSYPKVRDKIIEFYIEILEKRIGLAHIDYISGTATAAVPHATFIAQKINKPLVYVEISKDETKKPTIVGKLKKQTRAIVVEDHLTTGGSAVGNALALRKMGVTAIDCIVTTTYNMKEARKLFKQNGINVCCLTNIDTILEVAVEDGYLRKFQRAVVRGWIDDPENWARKHGFE